jgi:hypothetical protein
MLIDEMILRLLIRYTCFDVDREGIFFSADNIYKFIINNGYENVTLEAFSGSINSNLKNYCSLFIDIESKFGSKGSFFVLDKLNEYSIYICNPPFIKILIDHLFLKIMDMLNSIKNIDVMLIIPDHRSQQQVDNDKINEEYIGNQLAIGARYEGYSINYDEIITSKFIKRIFVMYNFKYHNHFKNEYHNIRTDTLIIYLSNNTDNTVYDKFKEYIKN